MWKTFAQGFPKSSGNGSGTGKTKSRRLGSASTQKCGKCGKLTIETPGKPRRNKAFRRTAILWISAPEFVFFSRFPHRFQAWFLTAAEDGRPAPERLSGVVPRSPVRGPDQARSASMPRSADRPRSGGSHGCGNAARSGRLRCHCSGPD